MTLSELSDAALSRILSRRWGTDELGDRQQMRMLETAGIYFDTPAQLLAALTREQARREDRSLVTA